MTPLTRTVSLDRCHDVGYATAPVERVSAEVLSDPDCPVGLYFATAPDERGGSGRWWRRATAAVAWSP